MLRDLSRWTVFSGFFSWLAGFSSPAGFSGFSWSAGFSGFSRSAGFSGSWLGSFSDFTAGISGVSGFSKLATSGDCSELEGFSVLSG